MNPLKHPLLIASALAFFGSTSWADNPATPKAPTAASAAQARYASDQKLCSDETSSNARLQCRRDAKAEYDKALAAATAKPEASSPAAGCNDCGKVVAVNTAEKDGKSNALGLLAGGAAGALLGNQIGGGTGKTIATVGGAAGGAYAGKKIQEKANAHKVWTVTAQFSDGSKHSFDFDSDPGFKVGDAVKRKGSSLER